MPDDATAHCSKLVAFHRGPVADAPRHLTSSMNSIFIRDLRIETRIGVYAWEKQLAQPLLLDIEFELPSSRPFTSDRLGDAIDYSAVVRRVQALAADHSHQLLERFTEAVAEVVCGDFGIPWIRVSVTKLAPVPGAGRIGVRIERGTRGGA